MRVFLLRGSDTEAWVEQNVPSRSAVPTYLQAFGAGFRGDAAVRTRALRSAASDWAGRLVEGRDEALLDVARSADLLVGKWMLYVPPSLVDAVFAALVRAAMAGEFSSPVSVKASTAGLVALQGRSEHTVCVYISRDKGDSDVASEAVALRVLERVRQVLAAAACPFVVGAETLFKLDVHTELDCAHGSFLYRVHGAEGGFGAPELT